MGSIGYSDLAEALALCFAALGGLFVLFPMVGAFCAAREFAMQPDLLVTPTDRWVFFDQVFQKRLRKWAICWVLLVILSSVVMGVGQHFYGEEAPATYAAMDYDKGPASFYVAMQCGASTSICILVSLTVVFLGMLFNPRHGFFFCSAILAVILICGEMIAVLKLGAVPLPVVAVFWEGGMRDVNGTTMDLDGGYYELNEIYPFLFFVFAIFAGCSWLVFQRLRSRWLLLNNGQTVFRA